MFQTTVVRGLLQPQRNRIDHAEESFRRFIFPGIYGTALVSEAHVTEQIERKTNFFTSLPLLSGHAMICSWWLELYQAAVDNDWRRVKKLYEAGLTITIRVRVGPSISQIVMDSISWSESVRTLSDAGSDSLLITVQKHLALPGVSPDIANCSIEKLRVRFCKLLSDAWPSALLPDKTLLRLS